METLPAKLETELLEPTLTIPLDAVLPLEVKAKLADVIKKWGSYTPAVITDAAIREVEYKDYSARKKLIKAIEAKQKLFNQPVKDLLEQVNSSFKAAVLAINGANARSEQMIQAFDAEIRAKIEAQRREQQAILDAEAAKQRAELAAQAEVERIFGESQKAVEIEKEVEAVKPMIAALPEIDLGGERLTWHFRIIDAAKVPDLFRIPSKPDEVKIGQMVRSAKGQINIEGVEVYSLTKLAGAR